MRSHKYSAYPGALILAFVASAVLVLVVLPALAADGTVSVRPLYERLLDPFLDEIIKGLVIFVGALASLVIHKILQAVKFIPDAQRAQLERQYRDSVNTALFNAGNMLRFKVADWEKAHTDIQVRGAVQRFMAQYAIDHAGDAVEHFGLDAHTLALKALAFIPDVSTTVDVAATIPVPIPVEVKNLDPLTNG